MGSTAQIPCSLFSCSGWFGARLQDKRSQGTSWHFRDSWTDWEISLIDQEISLLILPKSWRKWALWLVSPDSSGLASQVYHFCARRPDRNADEGQAEFPEPIRVYHAPVKSSIRSSITHRGYWSRWGAAEVTSSSGIGGSTSTTCAEGSPRVDSAVQDRELCQSLARQQEIVIWTC